LRKAAFCGIDVPSMTDFKSRIRPDWSQCLALVLARAKELGPKAVLAFDLDSTLFDNRPRQARIVREFGVAKGLPELAKCDAGSFTSGWDLRGALISCGIPEAKVEALYPELKVFWQERFFTSPYCTDDVAIDGAAEFVQAVARTGAQLCYVTGRHEGMREGTEAAMRQSGMPLPGGNVQLLMKPTLKEDDDAFKRQVHQTLPTLGTVIAAFDNEPMHANDYRRFFPEATVIHLATDHSGRPVELLEGIISVPHFELAS
jgi:hypothetical protein